MLTAAVSNVSYHWMLESRALFHMTPNKDYFSFVGKERSAILMENDASCKAMEEDTVQIMMFDGVIRILTGVRYVPVLRMSLISLGRLASMECKMTMKNDN